MIALIGPVAVGWYGLRPPAVLFWVYLLIGVYFDIWSVLVDAAKIRLGYGDSGEEIIQFWVYFWWTIANPLSLARPWQGGVFAVLVTFHICCGWWVPAILLRRQQPR